MQLTNSNFRLFLTLSLTFSTLLSPQLYSSGYNFKARAREHFESHHVKGKGLSQKYLGLNNTVNLWWEKPYDYSLGLSVSPIIAGVRAENENSPLGKRITLINYGFEYKSFLKNISEILFYRVGIGYSKLETTAGTRDYSGTNYYLGLGQEIPMNNFGLALEMAVRKAVLENSVTVESITPSIGFHFYKNL